MAGPGTRKPPAASSRIIRTASTAADVRVGFPVHQCRLLVVSSAGNLARSVFLALGESYLRTVAIDRSSWQFARPPPAPPAHPLPTGRYHRGSDVTGKVVQRVTTCGSADHRECASSGCMKDRRAVPAACIAYVSIMPDHAIRRSKRRAATRAFSDG